MDIRGGAIRPTIELFQTYTQHLGEGLIATDGVVYSPVATFGTTAVEILNKLIDPGFQLALKELEVGFTQKFEGLNGSFVASISYYWDARPEWQDPVGTTRIGAYVAISNTLTKGVGTLTTSEDTLSGYVPVGSVPVAPVRIRLLATGLRVAVCTGKVKNNSYIRLVGLVIPGT